MSLLKASAVLSWTTSWAVTFEEGTGRGRSSPRLLFAVPNVTAHPSAASVTITVLLYSGPLLCGFNVPIRRLTRRRLAVLCTISWFVEWAVSGNERTLWISDYKLLAIRLCRRHSSWREADTFTSWRAKSNYIRDVVIQLCRLVQRLQTLFVTTQKHSSCATARSRPRCCRRSLFSRTLLLLRSPYGRTVRHRLWCCYTPVTELNFSTIFCIILQLRDSNILY